MDSNQFLFSFFSKKIEKLFCKFKTFLYICIIITHSKSETSSLYYWFIRCHNSKYKTTSIGKQNKRGSTPFALIPRHVVWNIGRHLYKETNSKLKHFFFLNKKRERLNSFRPYTEARGVEYR
jgi:hypothetical protein